MSIQSLKNMRKHYLIALISLSFSIIYAQDMGVKLASGTLPNATLDVNGSVSFREGTALSLVNGANNDIALASYSFFRITGPTAAFSLTGCAGGVDGRMLTLINASGQTLTLIHQASSTSANQINTGGANMTITAGGIATLFYNNSLAKWVVTSATNTPAKFSGIGEGSLSDSMLVVNNGIAGRVKPVDFIKTYAWGLDGNAATTAGTNFVGTTDAQSLVFKTNNAEGMRLSTAQNLGIGTTTPLSTARLHVANSGTNHAFYAPIGTNYNHFAGKTAFGRATTDPSVTFVGTPADAFLHLQDSVTSFGTPIVEGIGVKLKIVPTASSAGLVYGINARTHTAAYNSQNIGVIESGNFDTRHYGTGTITSSYGLIARSVNLGGGRINKSYGIAVDVGTYGGIVDTVWGIQIGGGSFGTLTNANYAIGLHVGNVFATTAYGVFQEGNDDKNFFSGNVGIGMGALNPSYKLDVDAFTGASGNPLRLQGLLAGATTDSVLTSASGVVRRLSINQILGNAWNITGNSGTVDGTNYVGTADNIPLSMRVNNQKSGRVGIVGETYLGYQAGNSVTSGQNNTLMGYQAGTSMTTAWGNTALGYRSLYANTLGYANTATGDSSLYANTTGYQNTAIGYQSLPANTTGNNNTAVGYQALNGTSTGGNNVALGYQAGASNQTGTNNTFIGYNANPSGIAFSNATAIGYNANVGASNSMVLGGTGANAVNVGIGLTTPSVKLQVDGGNATATYAKFTAGTTTNQTSSDGFDVGVDASGNAILNQKEALDMVISTNNAEVVRVSSAGNVLIGALTPGEVTGFALVNQSANDLKDDAIITTYNSTTTPAFVLFKARGTAAAPSVLTNSENLGGFNVNGYIGSGFAGLTSVATITASDFTTSFGADIAFKTTRSGTSAERMRIMSTGNVGIGVAAPSHILQINGQGRATNSAWATSSDMRLKNIDENYEYGLKELLKINTYRFHYKKDNPLNLPTDKAFQGVIAQELQKVMPEAVAKMPDGYLTVSTDPIFWATINAVKELNAQNKQLKAEVEQLKAELAKQSKVTVSLTTRLERLEAALTPKETKSTTTGQK